MIIMIEIPTELEICRLQKQNRYGLHLTVPQNLARALQLSAGDLVRFGITDKKQILIEKFVSYGGNN
jgi:hypothetical protein